MREKVRRDFFLIVQVTGLTPSTCVNEMFAVFPGLAARSQPILADVEFLLDLAGFNPFDHHLISHSSLKSF